MGIPNDMLDRTIVGKALRSEVLLGSVDHRLEARYWDGNIVLVRLALFGHSLRNALADSP